RIFDIVEKYRPYVIFHAAAHKHVPLMETSPDEAVKNNIFGSYNVMEAAKKCKVSRFVLISSDKAVRPTNVMGATKRIIEMLVKSYNNCETTKFVAVRFGNVLCSNGSVIPIFQEQIANGGPVTVTSKEITRYFMTIPEAARLVIQASSFGRNGEIFVLDMGEPIKILDLAENLIRLSGFIPNEEIDILITGLRPGEKMYEELIIDEENCFKTIFKKIFIEKQNDAFDEKQANEILEDFEKAIENKEDVRKVLSKYIETYHYEKI
ncbi:MAG: polysaccharide biosynthesis protein, partial [Fusobacterium ulcerans]|uniref:polysaccharide biosynthesis protein n=1 Tax=Fusobacterium ulcerans TaxID=861 RepID=UPI003A870329